MKSLKTQWSRTPFRDQCRSLITLFRVTPIMCLQQTVVLMRVVMSMFLTLVRHQAVVLQRVVMVPVEAVLVTHLAMVVMDQLVYWELGHQQGIKRSIFSSH